MAAGVAASSVHILRAQPAQKYKTALIGSGWWGMNILRTAMEAGQSKVVALCDVDDNQLNPAAAEVEKLSGDKPNKYKDYRELLDKEKPEIVIVATPDHWHALAMIAAVKSGAHVYVEKPISHTLNEGRAMVKAARANNRIVQVGTHRRASPHNRSGMEFLKSGKAGKIGMVRAFVHYPGGPGRPSPESDPPQGLDWDMWCGPAPLRHYNRAIHPKGFRLFLDYANGQLGDWGIHWLDQILWWTDEKYPRNVYSTGGRFIKKIARMRRTRRLLLLNLSLLPRPGNIASMRAMKPRKRILALIFTAPRAPSIWAGWMAGHFILPIRTSQSSTKMQS